jgi:hypothetical protein
MSSTTKSAAAMEALGRAYLRDLIHSLLLERGEGLRSSDIAKGLRETLRVPNRLIKDELSADARFVERDRKWDLAIRHRLGDRPVEGALREIVAAAGRPVPSDLLVREMAVSRPRGGEMFGDLVPKLLQRSSFFRTDGDLFGLREWTLDVEAEDEELVRFQNFPDGSDELEQLLPIVEAHRFTGRAAATIAKEILELVGVPVSHKALSFLIWRARPTAFDAESLFAALASDPELVMMAGPAWCTTATAAAIAKTAERIAKDAADAAGAGVGEADVVGILQHRPPKGAEFHVSATEVRQLAERLAARGETAVLDELLTDVFDVYPEDEAFPAAVHAVAEALDAEESLVRVGITRWCPVSAVPAEVTEVPEELLPVHLDVRDIDGEEVDPVLSDDGLEPGLADAVHDPTFEDVGEEKEVKVPVKASKEIGECRFVLLHHHFRAGTLKVRQMDRGVIPKSPSLVRARFSYPGGEQFSVWINNETGLVYGLESFYNKYCPGSGAVLYLSPADTADTYTLRYDGESDDATYLDDSRLQDLALLRRQAQQRELSLFDLLCSLMEFHQQGAHFNTLVAEMNVVRRTARRDIASVLSTYHCFYQRKKRPELWHYDERKVSQGRMKQKRKFILKRR